MFIAYKFKDGTVLILEFIGDTIFRIGKSGERIDDIEPQTQNDFEAMHGNVIGYREVLPSELLPIPIPNYTKGGNYPFLGIEQIAKFPKDISENELKQIYRL